MSNNCNGIKYRKGNEKGTKTYHYKNYWNTKEGSKGREEGQKATRCMENN